MKISYSDIVKDIVRIFIFVCFLTILLCFYDYDNGVFTLAKATKVFVYAFLYFAFAIISMGFCTGRYRITEEKTFKLRRSGYATQMSADNINENIIVDASGQDEKEALQYTKNVNAAHEAGHALMCCLENIEGYYVRMSLLNPHVSFVCRPIDAEMIPKVVHVEYAGVAAEELVFGKMHTGGIISKESDFVSATELIKAYIVMTDPTVSKSLMDVELCKKVKVLSNKFYEETLSILRENKTFLLIVRDELLEKERLSKDEIELLINAAKPDQMSTT